MLSFLLWAFIAHFAAARSVLASTGLDHRSRSRSRSRRLMTKRTQPAKNITITIAARYGTVWSVKKGS
jgi:hypothetical protein